MEPEARPTLGERLSRRLAARENRRPRIGFTPSFYTRLGLEDPWMSEAATGGASGEGDGFVFLSAQPYYAMLRRLAAARRRRERRLVAFHERRAGTRMRAAQRSWPGEAPLATSRLARIALEDAVLPPSIPAPIDATPAQEGAPPARWSRRNAPTPGIRSAWSEREHVPARVVRGGDMPGGDVRDAERPSVTPATRLAASGVTPRGGVPAPSRAPALAHAGARGAVALQSTTIRALREATTLPLAGGARLRRIVEQLEATPPDEHVIVVRRAVRAAGTLTRQWIDVPALARGATRAAGAGTPAEPGVGGPSRAAASTATERATRRMADDPTTSLGLRPVLGRSPAMALAASAETDRASSGTLAEAAHTDGERIPVRASSRPVRASAPDGGTAARVATRERASAPRPASVLTVAVPRVAPTRAAGAHEGPAPLASRSAANTPVRTTPGYAAGGLTGSPIVEAAATVRGERLPATAHAVARAKAAAPSVVPMRAAPADGAGVRAAPPAPSMGATRTAPSARASTYDPVLLAPVAPNGAPPPDDAEQPRPARVSASQRAVARSAPSVATSLVPPPVAREPRPSDAPNALPRVVRLAAATVSAAPDATGIPRVNTPGTERPTRRAPPEQITATPVTAAQDTAAQDTAAPLPARATPTPRAQASALRRGAIRAAANAARRADGAPSGIRQEIDAPLAARRVPTGPLRYARGPTSRDLLVGETADDGAPASRLARDAARATRRTARTPASAILLAQAEAGTASVSAEAVVRIADASGAPFVTAREARRRGLQVVATERGLVAAAQAQDIARDGTVVPRAGQVTTASLPERRAQRGATRRLPGAAVDTRYVVPVEVVDVAAPDRDTTRATPVSAGARPDALRTRAVARAMARHDAGGATAYRGALRDSSARTVDARTVDVAVNAQGSDAAAADTAGRAPVTGARPSGVRADRGRGVTRAQRGADLAPATLAGPTPAGSSTLDTVPDAPRARRARAPLEERLAQVSEGRTDGATGWVDRAEGSPRLSTVSGLIRALARASSNEDVVRVIAARGDLPTDAARLPLDAPAVQVIQQIREEVRTEVVQVAATETRTSRLAAPEATALSPRALASTGGSERTRRSVRSAALRSAEATARTATGGDDRLSKLVRRLQDLIHLAEDQNRRADAQSQVRMAEDTAQAREEAQATSESRSPAAHKMDVEALGREVLDIVTKELELRRARRMEDSDESPWW